MPRNKQLGGGKTVAGYALHNHEFLVKDIADIIRNSNYTQADIATVTERSEVYVSTVVRRKSRAHIKFIKDLSDLLDIEMLKLIDTNAPRQQYGYAAKNSDSHKTCKQLSIPDKSNYRIHEHEFLVENILSLIYAKGYIQADIAVKTGRSNNYVSKVVRRKLRANITFIKDLAEILSMPVIDIIDINAPRAKNEYKEVIVEEPEISTEPSTDVTCEYTHVKPEEITTDIVPQSAINTQPLPTLFQTCTKCMFENVVDVVINSDFSYPADTIQKWAKRSICKMTDRDSIDYDPLRANQISDMLFRFFVNRKKPLREDARYFVREKNGALHLKIDHEEMDSLHQYTMSRSDENGTHVTRITMTENEKFKVESIFRELNIDCTIRDIVDILK